MTVMKNSFCFWTQPISDVNDELSLVKISFTTTCKPPLSFKKPCHTWCQNLQATLLFSTCQKGLWILVQLTISLLKFHCPSLFQTKNESRKVEDYNYSLWQSIATMEENEASEESDGD